jgi:hypothetical protein
MHFLYTYHAAVGAGFAQRAAVIYNEPFIFSWHFYHGMMTGAGGYGSILL